MSAPQATVWTPGSVYQGCPAEIWARLQRRDSSFDLVDILRADLSTITYKVTRSGVTTTATTSITVSSAVYDTLQNGTAWKGGNGGLNFAFTVPGSAFPAGGATYEVEFTFTLTGGDTFVVLVSVTTIPVP